MKGRRSLAKLLAFFVLISLLAASSVEVDAATARITDPSDPRIALALAGIDRQDFSKTATGPEEAKDKIRHFTFDSTFAAIGGSDFPYPNSAQGWFYLIQDNKYSESITGSKGCMAYSRFVSKVIYGREGDKRGEGNYPASRVDDFKKLLLDYGQAGDHIRAQNSTSGKSAHSLTLISCYDQGFYVLEHYIDPIRFTYWTYAEFVKEYSSHTVFLYDSNPGQNTLPPASFAVFYDPNGGTGVPPVQAEALGQPFRISTIEPKRPGYFFHGWAKQKNDSVPDYMPGSQVTLTQATGDIFTLYAVWVKDTGSFRDVPPFAWYFDYVENLAAKGIVKGYGSSGQFRPDLTVERQHIAKMVVQAAGIEYQGKTADFSDVPPDSEMSPYIAALAEQEVINGYPDGTFRPERSVSRAEVAEIIAKAFDLSQVGSLQVFPDTASHWAKDSISILSSNKVIKGYSSGFFKPDDPVTRAEASKMITIAMAVSGVQRAEAERTASAISDAQALIDVLPINQDLETRQFLQARLNAVKVR